MKNQRKESFKFKPFSKKQRQILNWWTDASPVCDKDGIIADGAIRSGKTVSMSLSFVIWAMDSFDGENFALCGKTIQSLRRNVIKQLKKMLNSRGYILEEHRSENFITIKFGEVENEFYLFGGKDEGSQDLIQGLTLAGVFFDEVALMPESFVNQATGRCSVEGSKFWFNCNPAGPQHWFKINWIDECDVKNLLYLHFTMDDNLSLSEKIKERYRSMYHGIFYDRYIRGLWVLAEGIIYRCFSSDKHVFDNAPETEGYWYVSSDYGIQNANVFLLWRKQKDSMRWLCLDEERWSGREENEEKSVAELVDGLIELLDRNNVDHNLVKWVIVDPSASALKVELKKRGFKVKGADNDVLDGITDVITMLIELLLGFSSKCAGTINEFGLYMWDAKAAERGEDKPIKTNDHGMDAVRYFVKTMKLVKRKDRTEDDYTSIYL